MPAYQVNITAVSDRAWFDLRKALQMVAGLGWLDARRLSRYVLAVDRNTEQYLHLPCVLVAGIDRATADHVAGLLRQAGATVSVEESTVQQPMLLCPRANQRYRWDDLRAKPVVDQPLSAKRRVARQVVWTALCVASITAVIAGEIGGFGVEHARAEGSRLIWVTSWSIYGAVLGAVYGAIWGLLKAMRRLSVWLQTILFFSGGMALLAALHSSKPYPSQAFSLDSTLGRTLFGAILGVVAGAAISFVVWLLRRMCLALLHLLRGGRTA
jgi:hypothetical protein